jgi:mono/diheme cytochrome c family protein
MRSVVRSGWCAGTVLLAACLSVILVRAAGAPRPGRSAEDIYLDKCAVCHGQDGAGKTAKGKKAKVKDIRETVGKMSVDEMIKVMEDGKGKNMDSYKKEYSKEQIKALVDYYRSLAKK